LSERRPRAWAAPCAQVTLAVALVAFAGCTPKARRAADDAGPSAAADAGCTYPLTVRDQRGVEVTVREPPRRIVSLLPSHTETLFALGLGPEVVGVDDFSADIPGAAGLPRLGGLYDAHLEGLLALEPDLALVSETATTAAPLEQAGVPTWGGSAARFEDIPRVIDAIGTLVCRSAQAARLDRQIAEGVAAVEQRVAGLPRVRVYYELDASLYTAGPRSFIGTMIAKAGGEDIVPASLGAFPKISPEAVIAGDPAVIFGVTLDDVRTRPGWDKIAAVREGRVYKLTPEQGERVTRPGPRIAEGLRILAGRIHPEAAP
jgi:iron complex transport system substrate-binding protein